jgi:hypothetical protein
MCCSVGKSLHNCVIGVYAIVVVHNISSLVQLLISAAICVCVWGGGGGWSSN